MTSMRYIWWILICIPAFTHADVTISEIAWMGTEVSHTDEWIELHNSDISTVSLDGWLLQAGDTFTIELTGVIGPGEYAVLERTNDESAPGNALLVYTGALSNKGATLRLTNSNGAVMDEVVGGNEWSNIGGNNATKETPQRVDGVWHTLPPTPGAESTVPAQEEKSTDDKPSLALDQRETQVINIATVHESGSGAIGEITAFLGLFLVILLGVFGIYAGRFSWKKHQ